jgi:hypothetical protein
MELRIGVLGLRLSVFDLPDDKTKHPEAIKLVPKTEDVDEYENSGHGGGDWLLAHDFVQAVAQQNPKLLTSTIDESIESHIMGFMAEESRKNNKVMAIMM